MSKKGPIFGLLYMGNFNLTKWTDDSGSRSGGLLRGVAVGDDGLQQDGLGGGSSALRAGSPRRSTAAAPNAEATNPKSPVRRRHRVSRTGGRLRGVSPEPSRNRAGGRRGQSVRTGEPDAGLWFHLTERDRLLLAVLGEHKVLTTSQVAEVAGAARCGGRRIGYDACAGLESSSRFGSRISTVEPVRLVMPWVTWAGG